MVDQTKGCAEVKLHNHIASYISYQVSNALCGVWGKHLKAPQLHPTFQLSKLSGKAYHSMK